jgi:small subunit ribosomal protein S15
MTLTKEAKSATVAKFQKHPKDTGTPAVQIALITDRINYLSEHLKSFKKDHASRLGLLKLVGQRRRLLNYLKKSDPQGYQKTLKALDLRK